VSGLAGRNNSEKISYARQHFEKGARAFKLFFDGTDAELLALVDDLRDAFGNEIDIFVDALWRLSPKTALELARSLESRKVGWLEAPLMPEDIRGHKWLALRAGIPIALGESYRTRFELAPFLENRAVDILQPDIGRIGITEGRKIACLADTFHVPVAPHISIGLGPQIAAALHFAHAVPNLMIVECNPMVFELANRVLREPLMFSLDQMAAPSSHGLGTELNDEALREFCT
jgi:galactonate dehydratase